MIVLAVTQRTDLVDLEDPQVRKRDCGRLEPWDVLPVIEYPNGWRVASGEGVVVPLDLARYPASASRGGWTDPPEGPPLLVSWDGGAPDRLSSRHPGQ